MDEELPSYAEAVSQSLPVQMNNQQTMPNQQAPDQSLNQQSPSNLQKTHMKAPPPPPTLSCGYRCLYFIGILFCVLAGLCFVSCVLLPLSCVFLCLGIAFIYCVDLQQQKLTQNYNRACSTGQV